MKQFVLLSLTCLTLWGCKQAPHKEAPFKMIDQVDFSQVHIQDNFWSPRLKKHISTTLPVCIDQIENQTGRIRNFENAAKREGEHSGIFFDDSDVYKALEGMAYSLINNPNPELEKKADEWIDKFAAAQLPDGYINTYYTLTAPEKRWTNMDKHEMYCAGHMIEAGVAYYKATGKRKLLDVCIRMTDHMMSIFGPGKRDWVPGHEEIELALVKLYQTTGEQKYLDFADWLIEERGHGHGSKGGEGEWDPFYYQDDKPVREMSDIAGHAVRCMYLYCGMADVAALKQDSGYIESLNRLWDDVVLRNIRFTRNGHPWTEIDAVRVRFCRIGHLKTNNEPPDVRFTRNGHLECRKHVSRQTQKGTAMIINGKEENVATPITVAELIESKGLRADRVAVELNGEIVPRTQRAQTQLKGTDTLEIVTFVQGG